jgi:hypothetical protein
MSEGLVTFFEYKQLGFYQRNEDYCEPLSLSAMLNNLHTWYNGRSSLADTLLWDDQTPGYGHRKKVYLKSIQHNPDTDDYMLILWRAVGSGDGVYGIRSETPLNDGELINADDAVDGESVIWGEPAYYWFAPTLNIFASIKFKSSVSDSKMMNNYFRDFMQFHSTMKPRVCEEKISSKGIAYISTHFSSYVYPNINLWLRIESQQCTKLTDGADLEHIASEITHFVRREVISAETELTGWDRFCGNLPFVSSPHNRETRRIEVSMDASPTAKQLQEMLETYNERFSSRTDNWVNLGFKKEGVGGTVWLNSFVLKNVLPVSDTGGANNDSGHYTTQRLFNALHLNRDSLLAPFTNQTPSYESTVELTTETLEL